ncbi:MAG: insulinase family protein [Clostridiaceae bacterium]|nr:insulinase family protein [Clostridiaceae bacterium]
MSIIEQSAQYGFHMQETRDHLTGQTLRTWRHKSGMMVKVLPRPGFSKRFAAMTVPYGSIHQSFTANGRRIDVPAGSAHFLEHCVFSRDDEGGLLGKLSALGASANAYTSHTHTMYFFSAVHNFEDALKLYLGAVLDPYLEQDRVEAERPVILAELSQYLDDPDNRCYMQLLENLYEGHPVKQDIGGTLDSVVDINSDHLKSIHSAYYRPGSLSLTVAGDFDEEKILADLLEFLPERPGPEIIAIFPDEPENVIRTESQLKMDISAPSFLCGIKDPEILPHKTKSGLDLVGRQRAARLMFDTLLSPVSPVYETLYSEGLINESFGYHYACESSFAFLAIGGESPEPEKASDRLIELLMQAVTDGIDNKMFEIQKRAAAGDFVRSLDAVEHSGMVQAQCNLHKVDLFDYPLLYDKMDAAAADYMLSFLRNRENYSVSIVREQ